MVRKISDNYRNETRHMTSKMTEHELEQPPKVQPVLEGIVRAKPYLLSVRRCI